MTFIVLFSIIKSFDSLDIYLGLFLIHRVPFLLQNRLSDILFVFP